MAYNKTYFQDGDTLTASHMNTIEDGIISVENTVKQKQDKLVSGTNLVTVNGQSLLGAGNLQIEPENTIIDDKLSSTSVNPVQNKVVKNALDTLTSSLGSTVDALAEVSETLNDTILVLNEKQDKLSTNDFKTINGQSVLGAGEITISGDGTSITVDSALSTTSTNPVQNKVITVGLTSKQDTLVSGTSIKTINGESILGSGDITISGGTSATENKKSISILFVGNSLTQDGIAYLPYMLKTYYPEVNFKLYIWYTGSYTLGQHYSTFTSGGKAEIFSVAENTGAWTNSSKSVTMASVLSTYQFDIVCMQEYFNYKESYTDVTDWNNCRNYIMSNYKGGNALEFISLFHAPLRKEGYDVHEVYERTRAGNALILHKTISEDVIPNGIAVYRALDTSLNSLGDSGQLSPDGTHTQEGLPCLLQTYTTLCWLFDRLGINKSVYGHAMRMTTDIYNSINVPGPNLGKGVVTGTDAQNLLAQEVAIQAYKEGKQFTVVNLWPFEESLKPVEHTLSITANIADAVIKINGVEQSSITVAKGTTVNWEVTKDGFHTQNGSIVVNKDTTLNIELITIVEIESVTAEFAQGARTIFSNQELEDLRSMLTVTVNYVDGTSEEVDTYTLSGSLENESSSVVASFGEKSATFEVNVTPFVIPDGYTRYGYIQGKGNSGGSAQALTKFIYLNDQVDHNTLSMEAILGEKPNVTRANAGSFGARITSSGLNYYGVYIRDAGVSAYARGVSAVVPLPGITTKFKLVVNNPETSPISAYINDGKVVSKEWTDSPEIPYGLSLFNNVPRDSTSALYINHSTRIGDIILRKADGECVGYYTPAVKNNVIGMYDQVTKQFYTAETVNAVTVGNSACIYAVGDWT